MTAKSIVHCNIGKYADDTVLFISHQDVDVVEKLLNKDFYNICHWLEENELIINLKKGKTEFMVFGTKKRLSCLNNPPIKIQYNNTIINFTISYKYLGLLVNNTLNMSEHITMTITGFYFMGAKYFNELPYSIRNADSLSVFKDRLNKYLL